MVQFAVDVHVPARDEVRSLGEGYHYFDPFVKRIAVAGFFRDGRVGSGYLTPFDTATHERVVRIHARQPNGSHVEIRDTFWVIDANTWGNRTYAAVEGAWRVVSDEIDTRVEL